MSFHSDIVPISDGTMVHLKFVESVRIEPAAEHVSTSILKDDYEFELNTVSGKTYVASTRYISSLKEYKCTQRELLQAIFSRWSRINRTELL